jgi:2'-5' RNA ligase
MRTFIAINLPSNVKRMLAKYTRDVSGRNYEYKWVARENLHITLAFLGEVPLDDITRLNSAIERTAANQKPFEVQIGGVGTFGSVIWVGISLGEEKCQEIYNGLRSELMMMNFHLDDRRYHPHITVARSRRRMDPETKRRFETNEPPKPVKFEVTELALYESKLMREGPEYIQLNRVKLGTE